MAHEIVVSTRIIQGNAETPMCIGIDGGRITAVERYMEGERIFHFEDYLALPGGVDIHTHMREPGMTHKEDFFTGTMAAAFGGTTTILDMPNTLPAVTDRVSLKEKLNVVKGRANVDFGLFAQLTDIDLIEEMAGLAMGFKLFMSDTTGTAGGVKNPLEILLNSDYLAGRVVTVHAEEPDLFGDGECTDLHRHNLIRNMKAELAAVERILAVEAPVNLNLAHLTTRDSVEMARAGKASFELTPHHLLLHDASGIGTLGKVNPPLRKKPIAEHLFNVLKTGRAIIASDHAPHSLDEKNVDFQDAPSGLPGVETRVPLMMALARTGAIRYDAVQNMCCTLPAKLFGLNKGRIEPGYDADLAFYDIADTVKVEADMLHSKCGWTPFEGFDAIFPKGVMLRGKMIVRGGELAVEKSGIMLQPGPRGHRVS